VLLLAAWCGALHFRSSAFSERPSLLPPLILLLRVGSVAPTMRQRVVEHPFMLEIINSFKSVAGSCMSHMATEQIKASLVHSTAKACGM